jgi:hypothetical protein
MFVAGSGDKITGMFTVDEATAEAIRRAVDHGGELAGVVELRRYFPLLADTDNAQARRCVQMILGWRPLADPSGANTTARARARPRPKPDGQPTGR